MSRDPTSYSLPIDETRRLTGLESPGQRAPPPEEHFDRILCLTCRMFGVPLALLDLLGKNPRCCKSRQGTAIEKNLRDTAFNAYTAFEGGLLEIPDTLADPRFADNRLVTGEPFIRFYAGRPLYVNEHRIGTLCLIDQVPKTLNNREKELFDGLGRWAECELELDHSNIIRQELIQALDHARRKALRDPLTGCWNREGIFRLLERELAYAARLGKNFGIAMLDLDHFKPINDTHGHLVGDAILGGVVQRIRSVLRAYDSIGRYGGEEFLLIIADCNEDKLFHVAEKVRHRIAAEPVLTPSVAVSVTASIGITPYRPGHNAGVMIERADQALYQAKRAGRNQVQALD